MTLRLRAFTVRPRHVSLWSPSRKAYDRWVCLVADQHWGACSVDALILPDRAVRYQRCPANPTHEIEQELYV